MTSSVSDDSMGIELSLWTEDDALQGTVTAEGIYEWDIDHVSVSGSRLSFRVPYTDGGYISCTGRLSGDDRMSGSYEDFNQGSKVDHGTWEVDRDTRFRVRSSETRPEPARAAGSVKSFLGLK
ncbi:MAG: hypothetical protein ABFE07_25760 [Armatimonadia bacterium]